MTTKKLRKPKLPPVDDWLADIPDPYRHCKTCKHQKPKEYPFGLCKKGLHQADDERCQEYRQKNTTGKPIIDTETL